MKKTIIFIVMAMLCLFFRVVAQQNVIPTNHILTGSVTDEQGKPLPGATIKLKDKLDAVTANADGKFALNVRVSKGTLLVSFIGYQSVEIPFDQATGNLRVELKVNSGPLNEVQVIGYGTTTKRFNTGSVSSVSAEVIGKQPVTNVLSALEGRAAGVFVQTSSGLPGGNVIIQIRGQNSLRNDPGNNGNYPLYIIDGVPYPSGPLNPADSRLGLGSIAGAVSPFNSLNPADIASISILKDADATAIYGSRGANGVVLITTKKGKSGKTLISVNYVQGISKVSSYPQVLDLGQYLEVRKEAFKNDGLTPSSDPSSASYAPDLTVWSQTQSTDWPKKLMGLTASTSDLQCSISGGNESSNFLISSNYRSEGSVLLGGGGYKRAGLHVNLSSTSLNKKFSVQLVASYTGDDNKIANPVVSLFADILTPPNFPVYDSQGNLNWSNNINPLADIKAQTKTQTNTFVSNIILKYNFLPNLNFQVSGGYTKLNSDQTETLPLAAQNPSYGISSANYGQNSNGSFIVEPQLNYTKHFEHSTLTALLGGTYQNSLKQGDLIIASNFSNDGLIENAASASNVSVSNSYSNYKYESIFGRLTYNFNDKYILNGSVRRDGSSRFGPGDQFGNFGAIGAAWLFDSEPFIKDHLSFISYGKLRASYGITGNDQITDYQYLSTYGSSGNVYQGISGLQSTQIANADLHWENNKKLEAAIELGLFKDRVLLTVDRFRNRSSNQLISYTLPYLTGFASYEANLPAVVQNTGWEFELNTINIKNSNFSWQTTFNLTIPENKLLSFPGLATSSYANTLTIGQDINQASGYKFTGVDPQTGLAQYASLPGQTDPYNNFKWGQASPYLYGGFGNTFTYSKWQLDIFGQFSKQFAKGGTVYSPGLTTQNDYSNVINRWQYVGQIATVPKPSTNYDPYYAGSSANWFNASYFRLKNVSLSYAVPTAWLSRNNINSLKIFFQGQNLLTIWKKQGALFDPETGANNIAPLKSFIAGIQITL